MTLVASATHHVALGMQDEVAYREQCKLHLDETAASARKAQLYTAFIDHPAPKMAEMGEHAISKLQSTQHIASTDDFEHDTLAIHSTLEEATPAWDWWPAEALSVPAFGEPAAALQAAPVSQMAAVTVLVRLAYLFPRCLR